VNGQADGTLAIVFGQSVNGTINPAGDTDTFTVLVLPGMSLGIELERTGGQPAFAPVWDAFDVHGRNLGHGVAGERGSVVATGIVTILVSDAQGTATGTYTLSVGPGQPTTTVVTTSTTSTTGNGDTTTSTTGAGQTTTSTTGVGNTTTSTSPGETTTTVDATTTTGDDPTTTSSTASPQTTTTGATIPDTTTTTLPPLFDLGFTFPEPPISTPPMLGRALAAGDGLLIVGAPNADAVPAPGAEVVPNAGVVLAIDVSGAPGSPAFGSVRTTLTKPPAPVSNDEFGAAVALDGSPCSSAAPGARAAYSFPNVDDPSNGPVTLVSPVGGEGDPLWIECGIRGRPDRGRCAERQRWCRPRLCVRTGDRARRMRCCRHGSSRRGAIRDEHRVVGNASPGRRTGQRDRGRPGVPLRGEHRGAPREVRSRAPGTRRRVRCSRGVSPATIL
jgi:hypothetical protein